MLRRTRWAASRITSLISSRSSMGCLSVSFGRWAWLMLISRVAVCPQAVERSSDGCGERVELCHLGRWSTNVSTFSRKALIGRFLWLYSALRSVLRTGQTNQ